MKYLVIYIMFFAVLALIRDITDNKLKGRLKLLDALLQLPTLIFCLYYLGVIK